MTPFSPAYDNKITKKYSAKTLQQKIENKVALQEKLGWNSSKDQMMTCVPQGLQNEADAELLLSILPGLISLGIQTLIVGRANRTIAEKISCIAKENPTVIHIVPDEEIALRKMYAAADTSVFLVDSSGSEELYNALRYGAVPIALQTEELQNYNAIQESGNSFIVPENSMWLTFAAIVRAKETFQFPYDFRTIQRHCMSVAE